MIWEWKVDVHPIILFFILIFFTSHQSEYFQLWFGCEDFHPSINFESPHFVHLHLCLLGLCVICQYVGRIIIWFLGVKGFQNVVGVGTCFQVDLLVVYDYYSMWNPKWKAMCFFVCAFIIAVNMGVMIGVVNGWAHAKVIMKSWSPNRSCLTLDLPRHIN